MSLHARATRIWNAENRTAGIVMLRSLLRLPAFVFGIAVRLRNRAYDQGWIRQERLPVRVISVGGITVGGAGKTPVVRYLARILTDVGQRVTILSRGYGRQETETAVVSDHNGMHLSWEAAGDEPYFLASTLPDVPVIVGADRAASGRLAIEKNAPDVLLLDDGFQHRRLARNLDILVIDAASPGTLLLPAGPLREPWSSLRRADLIVLTRIDQTDTLNKIHKRIQQYNPEAPVMETAYRPTRLRRLSDNEFFPLDHIAESRVVTLSGIANPGSFELTIRQIGAEIAQTLRYRDHHVFQTGEITAALKAVSQTQSDWIITTEKDAVRIPEDSDRTKILVLDIELEIVRGKEAIDTIITNSPDPP